jgi:hypothetical protein
MASSAKVTKAIRGRKVTTRKLRRGRRVKAIVSERLTVLKALEAAVSPKNS